jgi:tRNA A37 N6-isopentenylltransferase MiaA
MDFLDPEEEYKVTEFKKDASQCVSSVSLILTRQLTLLFVL